MTELQARIDRAMEDFRMECEIAPINSLYASKIWQRNFEQGLIDIIKELQAQLSAKDAIIAELQKENLTPSRRLNGNWHEIENPEGIEGI